MPIVFVHGLSGRWQNWLENIPHFAREHRVLALDLPGFGHSPMPEWEISIEGYGRLLHDFCDALGVRDCAVIGNSMGGFISAEAASARARPVREARPGVRRRGLPRAAAPPARRDAGADGDGRGAAPAQASGARPAQTACSLGDLQGLVPAPRGQLRRELLLEQFQNGAGRPGFLPAVQGLVGYDILDQLTEVEVPTLIVWGRNDRVVPPQDAAGFAERLRNSQTVIFDDTGHLPQLERPTRFNRVLETFLAG